MKELHAQCQQNLINFEIRLYDDGSERAVKEINAHVLKLDRVVYQELSQNLGRSQIRNKLAQEAAYSHILFLDNDCEIIRDNLIRQYLINSSFAPVLIGGTIYNGIKPPPNQRLRWLYGIKREQRTVAERNKHPYAAFFLNNIFLPRELFLQNPLPILFEDYGHEDSLFGLALERAGVKVWHLDNPVVHLGLESNREFLIKTEKAIHNLYALHNQYQYGAQTKLIRSYNLLKQLNLREGFVQLGSRLKTKLVYKLTSATPSLLVFDIYKLWLFTKVSLQAERNSTGPK